jgi:hypothetical protein
VQALRAIPSIAWVPLFILWLGIFEASKVVLIAVGVFVPVYLGLLGAMLAVDRKIVEVGRIFRLSGPAMIRRILLPAVLPAYVVALRAGLGLGWMFVVAAEFMGAAEGLGYHLVDGQQLGKPAQIVAVVGTSGCGKSTLLRIVSGLDPPSRGRIALDGAGVDQPREEIGIVFQGPRLLPWLSVERNVGFGLEGRPAWERAHRVNAQLARVGVATRPTHGRANCPAATPSASRSHAL